MKTVHVAAGIIRKEGSDELLAVQRGYGDMQGLWEFPGGKLMRGETPEDAVRRELMEELQVKVTNLRDFYTVEYDYPDFHLSMECYYCSLADESDEPQKHDRQLDIPAVFQLVHHQRDEGIRLNQAGVREGDRQREHEKKRGEPKERPNVCTHEKKPPENQTCKQGSSSMPGRKSKYSDGSSAPPCARA